MSTCLKISIATLFLIVLFFSVFYLKESPPFNFDEGWHIQSAANLAETGIEGLQMAPGYVEHISTYVSIGYPFIYTLALWFKVFGDGILQAKILMVIFLLGFAVLSFLLAKRLFGNRLASASLALIALFPPLYGNGKAVMGEVPGMFFMLAALLCFNLIKSYPYRKYSFLILAGFFAGLAISTKVAFVLMAPALLVAVIIEWKRKLLSVGDVSIICLSALAPIAIWFAVKFQPGDSAVTVLSFYANPSNLNSMSATVVQNLKILFTDTGPLYTVLLMGVWISSIFLRWRTKTIIAAEEVAALIFSILTIMSFTRTIGFYRYLFPAQVMALIFFPNSLRLLLDCFSDSITFFKSRVVYATVIFILVFVGLYQLAFDSYVADSYGSRDLAEMEEYFSGIDESVVFFYNSTGVVPLFKGKDYYQYLLLFNKEDWVIGEEWLQVLASGRVDIVVAGPRSQKDERNGVFDPYIEVRKFGKISILKPIEP